MKVQLSPNSNLILENGKYDLRKALIDAGVKAAVCFKEPQNGIAVTPQYIRENETEEQLILRAIETIFSDHGSPTEQQNVSLEITGIPKILCMILNNEKQYAADERSLRYTEVEPNTHISELEVRNYQYWLEVLTELIDRKYGDFYRHISKSEKGAQKAMRKLAQENARYQVSVFMPTLLTYTVPLAQINKICKSAEQFISHPKSDLEERVVPYLKDFVKQLKELDVGITKDKIFQLCDEKMLLQLAKKHPEILNFSGNDELFYQNNKSIELSLFADRNAFTTIYQPNQYGPAIHYNCELSFAALAQNQRHRTEDVEMSLASVFKSYTPPILDIAPDLKAQWQQDMLKVSQYYPQGQLVDVNIISSIKRILSYVATERCCERAQLEIEQFYTQKFLPDIYQGLIDSGYEKLAEKVKPYVKRLRCQFPNYHCPSPCGHPRIDRKI